MVWLVIPFLVILYVLSRAILMALVKNRFRIGFISSRRQASTAWSVLCDCIVTAGMSNFRLRYDGVPLISTPALVRGVSQAARKGGCSSSARSLIQRSTQISKVNFLDIDGQQFYRAMTSDFCYPAFGDLSLDDKPNLNYECQIWDTAVQFFYRALTSEVYLINWSKPFFISVAMLCYASVAILHAFGALSLYDKPKLSYRPPLLPVDGTKKRNFAADEEEPTFLAACESPLTNAGVEITISNTAIIPITKHRPRYYKMLGVCLK
ncbi:hypothetical protein OUZ56_026257 [Daphnia magna]|uniref:Uncharacterized protein n=1 Tax=Daphnia magna TaxID=35525 RepID=A0ABQ9ZM76_9CRUS|nr:hypothetical protein OUZ56_026257 [Daphnia magna]